MYKLTPAVWIVLLFTLASSQSTDRPIITTPQGQVQGVTLTNNNGLNYYAFRGIPFAEPPVGELRFMRPVAASAWADVLDASVEASKCYQQKILFPSRGAGDEDCLYLNVYIPELPDSSSEAKAVMVWIYGGGFMEGDSYESMYGSGKLMGYDVITVTLNYRVGAFGFLSTADDVIPGNYGLRDQLLALQWVQDNIAAFGGDPDRVTVFGQSAGSWSTSSLLLSPQASGLFHAAISESGSQILPWTCLPDPVPYAQTLAGLVNCPEDNSTLMLSCLQTKTSEEIFEAQAQIPNVYVDGEFYFLPVVDGQLTDAVFPQPPLDLIRNGLYNKVPYINGVNEKEGAIFYATNVVEGTVYDQSYINNNLSQLVTQYTLLTGDELTQVTSLVYEEYFSQIDLDNNTAIGEGVQEFISDSLMNVGHFLLVSLLPKGDGNPPIYSYVFTYAGEYMDIPHTGKPSHGDELVYIFDIAGDNGGILNAQDNVTSERILTLWTTFAKTGNPNPTSGDVIEVTWEAVTSSDSIPYINIGSELSMEEGFRDDRMQFWNSSIVPVVLPSY